MTPDERDKQLAWLQQTDIQSLLLNGDIPSPWFPAYRGTENLDDAPCWYSAFVPMDLIPKLVNGSGGWEVSIGDFKPGIWTRYTGKGETQSYAPFGNESGIEPLVLRRTYHGIKPPFVELAQEFRLYHNLYPEPGKQRLVFIDDNGDETEAARYGDRFLEVRTDLLLEFCAAKQIALGIYVDSFRLTEHSLDDLGLKEIRANNRGETHTFSLSVVASPLITTESIRTMSRLVGKKYVLPRPRPTDDDRIGETYQEFIVDEDARGQPVRSTCDPESLANYFGKNPEARHYLTPVFFRPEVLAKYYADPKKYSVEDGCLSCSGLWGLRMDNDHRDYVVVFLGDLGTDLSETERNYWLSFNIPPGGRTMSQTTYRRGFLAEFADPQKPDLVLKHEYRNFNEEFRKANGWYFFLPLHADDVHFLTGLHLLLKDNQAEFDSQLIALTKILVDSLNEKELAKGLTTLTENDKGITKLEKYFKERGTADFEPHVKFLRGLQDLRSRSAAHRKGSTYESLIEDLGMADEGQQRVFERLLTSGVEFIRFLRRPLSANTEPSPEDRA